MTEASIEDSNDKISFTTAFNRYFKELAVDEFPTGNGDWRNNMRYRSDDIESKDYQSQASLYTTESLLELASIAPFEKNTEWSCDAKNLLHESIMYPKKIYGEVIHRKFKRLRIIDKNVNCIDEGIKRFENLTELIISANQIKTIHGKMLPRSLKQLELCGNYLSDIGYLCHHAPPTLNYVGLSHNQIYSIHEYIKPQCWEHLLLLDLSFNHIHNLKDTITAVKLLSKLRSLLLRGNPLYFFLGYRGVLIDSLKLLSILDDIHVSADERLSLKGMSKLKGLIYDQFVFNIKLDSLKGLKQIEPEAVTEEYPKTIIKYHIQIKLPFNFTIEDEEKYKSSYNKDEESTDNVVVTAVEDEINKIDSLPVITEDSSYIKTKEFTGTNHEEVLQSFNQYISANDIVAFHQFIKQPIKMEIIINHITVSNEPNQREERNNTLDVGATTGIAKEKSNKSVDRSKSKQSVAKMGNTGEPAGKAKGGKSKGNKQDTVELHEWSRTQKVYATCQVDCQLLLEDTNAVEEECVFEIDSVIAQEISESLISEEHSTKKMLDPKKKISKDVKRGGSARSITSVRKNKAPDTLATENTEDSADVNVPLTIQFYLRLEKWESAKDAWKYLNKNV